MYTCYVTYIYIYIYIYVHTYTNTHTNTNTNTYTYIYGWKPRRIAAAQQKPVTGLKLRVHTRSPSQDSPSQDFRQGLGCSGTYFFIGSGVRFSRVWVRKDGNLLTETGCMREKQGGAYIHFQITLQTQSLNQT